MNVNELLMKEDLERAARERAEKLHLIFHHLNDALFRQMHQGSIAACSIREAIRLVGEL